MAVFEVAGPFDVTYENRKGGRSLVFSDFWLDGSDASELADKCGCYVFAVRNGRGCTPIYVGKATKTFRQEAFNKTNLHKYQSGFSEYGKGRPVMFFVVHPSQKGKTNSTQISQVEDFLIQVGVAKNHCLQNIRGRQQPTWSIKGVIRNGPGKKSALAKQFCSLFNI